MCLKKRNRIKKSKRNKLKKVKVFLVVLLDGIKIIKLQLVTSTALLKQSPSGLTTANANTSYI